MAALAEAKEGDAVPTITRTFLDIGSQKGAPAFLDLTREASTAVCAAAEAVVAGGEGAALALDETLEELAGAVRFELDSSNAESASGLVVVRGLPVPESSAEHYEAVCSAYSLALANLLGVAVPQSQDLREVVGRVEVAGPGVPSQYRGYRNAKEQKLHSDSPAPDTIDVVLMHCVRPAASGGASRFAAASHITGQLAAHAPEALARLQQRIPYSCRKEWVEEWGGRGPVGAAPLIGRDWSGNPTCQYAVILRENIEAAAEEEENEDNRQELTGALDALEAVANDPGTFFKLRLDSGSMAIMDNKRWLHARDSFEDSADSVWGWTLSQGASCRRIGTFVKILSLTEEEHLQARGSRLMLRYWVKNGGQT